MVKYNQTIRRQKLTSCLSIFDHFVGLALKGLIFLLIFIFIWCFLLTVTLLNSFYFNLVPSISFGGLKHFFKPYGLIVINPLSTKPTKWSKTLKQFVGCCRQIVWVCLAILCGWRLTGKWLQALIENHSFRGSFKIVCTFYIFDIVTDKTTQPFLKQIANRPLEIF